MTDLEREMMELTKDVAVVVNIQKTCQKSQSQTTANVNKLVTSVNQLSHDTVYLRSLVTRLEKVEGDIKWFNRTSVTVGAGVIGTILWFFMKMPK